MDDRQSRIEDFFAEPGQWQDELLVLRGILQDTHLTEDFKWSSPCYTYDGSNVATLWGMKEYATLSFFKGALLSDPEGLLQAPGANSQSVRFIPFTDLASIRQMEPTLRAYINEAIENERSGKKVEFSKEEPEYPDELTERLANDAELNAAFQALTPGRRRGYVLHFSQAKQSSTRAGRIEKAIPRILEGKGMHDR